MRISCGWIWLAALAALGCAGSEATTAEAGADRDVPLAAHRGSLTARTLLSGELVAEDAELLVAPNVNVWPMQIRWLAEDGAEVRQGETVVEFDNTQLTTNLEQLRSQAVAAYNQLTGLIAQAAAAEATAAYELEQQRATVAKARLEAEVPEEIFAAREYQKRQLDLRKAELELTKAEAKLTATRRSKHAEVDIQRIALAKAESALARAESKLDLLVLRASRDGIVVWARNYNANRQMQVGDDVFPGTVVARLPDLATMIIESRLFDVDDGRVAVGMPVVATLDAFPDRPFAGRVRKIEQIAEQPSSRSLRRFFRTTVELDDVDVERMRPGMSVKVVIDDVHENALLVPRSCLDWSAAGPRALGADGTWAAVTLGPCDRVVCIVRGGLEESAALRRVALDRGES